MNWRGGTRSPITPSAMSDSRISPKPTGCPARRHGRPAHPARPRHDPAQRLSGAPRILRSHHRDRDAQRRHPPPCRRPGRKRRHAAVFLACRTRARPGASAGGPAQNAAGRHQLRAHGRGRRRRAGRAAAGARRRRTVWRLRPALGTHPELRPRRRTLLRDGRPAGRPGRETITALGRARRCDRSLVAPARPVTPASAVQRTRHARDRAVGPGAWRPRPGRAARGDGTVGAPGAGTQREGLLAQRRHQEIVTAARIDAQRWRIDPPPVSDKPRTYSIRFITRP